MQALSLNQPLNTKAVFTTGILKMLEFFKFTLPSGRSNTKPDKSSTAYLLHLAGKGQTVFKIGPHEASTLYFLSQKVGDAGKVVVFEPHANLNLYLTEIKQLLSWSNVIIEHTPLLQKRTPQPVTLTKKDKTAIKGATVISIDAKYKKGAAKAEDRASIDKYCLAKNTYPDLLRIDANGEEFDVITGAIETIKTHKPKVVVSCDERKAGKEKIQAMFRLLIALNYKGYFLLDSMLLPLENFDFDVYQNSYADFYCNVFVFI